MALRAAVPLLPNVSNERIRDELFKILDGQRCSAAIRTLDYLGIIAAILPELVAMKGTQQSSPHLLDVWEHTLASLNELERIFDLMVNIPSCYPANNLSMGSAMLILGKYRPNLREQYRKALNPSRSGRALLFFSALYHDSGKPATFKQESRNKIRFLGHETESHRLATTRARKLALSQVEIQRIDVIIKNHMRIHSLAKPAILPSPRAIYRFFRDAGPGGIDICLLSLADTQATYGVTLTAEQWNLELDICRELLEAWWEKHDQVIAPPLLLNGDDLQQIFNLQPGPLIGTLLGDIRESQATMEINTREDAIIYARNRLNRPE